MASLSSIQLLDGLRAILDGAALRDADALVEQSSEPPYVVSELVRRQRLTAYQAEEVLAGRGGQLVLGPYLLLEPIGKGGMGHVFRARQKVLERECAVKIVRKDRLQTEESIERFLREARAAARLKHPNIVGIYDANVSNGVHFLAMELLHGVTLADHVKKDGPLSVGHAARYLRQAALGLQHAYEQGLVHRDIKPQNLFLEKASDQLKILDLGLARVREIAETDETATGELTKEGEVMGTPDYMAPEQALDTRSADHRADIYSLGCTLYFLLTGRPPFPGGSLTEKLLAHQQRQPAALDHLVDHAPPQLVAVLKRALAKQPDDRYQTAAEFADALAPLEHVEQIIAAPAHAVATRTTLTRPATDSTDARPPSIAKPSSSWGWLLVLGIVGLAACCPLTVVGLGMLGVGALVLVPAGDARRPVGAAPVAAPLMVAKENAPVAKREIWEMKFHDGRNFVLSQDGTRMIHDVSEARFAFEVRETESGKRYFDLPKGLEGLGFAAGVPPRVVAARDRATIFLLNANTGEELSKFPNPFQGFAQYEQVADGKSAVVAVDKHLIVWDLQERKEKHRAKLPDFPRHLSVSVDGELALLVCENRLRTWSLPNDAAEREYFGCQAAITCTALAPDGKWIVAGCGQGDIYLWKTDDPKNPRVLKSHADKVHSAVFSPDSQRMLSGGQDRKMIYWDILKGSTIEVVVMPDAVTKVAINANGRGAVSASADKKIITWRLPK